MGIVIVRRMALTCQTCGTELPDFPQKAVEDGEIPEVVAYTFDPDGIAVSETAYYCEPECFTEDHV